MFKSGRFGVVEQFLVQVCVSVFPAVDPLPRSDLMIRCAAARSVQVQRVWPVEGCMDLICEPKEEIR
ncbi:hypothetical protein TM5383_02574 [Thalassovita mediterranea]|jgi:hypothetical protein|uniref:Uncharacterized protein n=1 Tax=Thalassovita mediterranea TaxID=340021 RepID=A0A0P1GRJ7_9RHOB|nr:hypothetical protein TM5383_02574 [Thalassovita mediterranea]SIS30405.1 hypothetical protein SAMN05421685_10342 [Thalassovita mediterranea]